MFKYPRENATVWAPKKYQLLGTHDFWAINISPLEWEWHLHNTWITRLFRIPRKVTLFRFSTLLLFIGTFFIVPPIALLPNFSFFFIISILLVAKF